MHEHDDEHVQIEIESSSGQHMDDGDESQANQ